MLHAVSPWHRHSLIGDGAAKICSITYQACKLVQIEFAPLPCPPLSLTPRFLLLRLPNCLTQRPVKAGPLSNSPCGLALGIEQGNPLRHSTRDASAGTRGQLLKSIRRKAVAKSTAHNLTKPLEGPARRTWRKLAPHCPLCLKRGSADWSYDSAFIASCGATA